MSKSHIFAGLDLFFNLIYGKIPFVTENTPIFVIAQVPFAQGFATKENGEDKPIGGNKNERYFNETVIRSRCSLWTSDKKMEP